MIEKKLNVRKKIKCSFWVVYVFKSTLPQANSIVKWCISKAIFGMDVGPFTQQIRHYIQMLLTCGNVKGSAATIICIAQVSPLYRKT